MSEEVLFRADQVSKRFQLPRTSLFKPRRSLTAVKDVSFQLRRGETLGVVGESGSGKTTLVRLMLGLERPDAGSIVYTGGSLTRDVQVVFQDPASALDPRMRAGEIIVEPLRVMRLAGNRKARLDELLDAVGLTRDSARRLSLIHI